LGRRNRVGAAVCVSLVSRDGWISRDRAPTRITPAAFHGAEAPLSPCVSAAKRLLRCDVFRTPWKQRSRSFCDEGQRQGR
jgi:hypothetical protein